MTMPTINVSFQDLQNEFGGTNPISLSEYYSGGGLVSNPAPKNAAQTGIIPTGGVISLGVFKGVKKPTVVSMVAPAQIDMYPMRQTTGSSIIDDSGPWNFSYNINVYARNLHILFSATGGLPVENSDVSYTWWWEVKNNGTNPYNTRIRQPQDHLADEDFTWTPAFPIPQNQPNMSIIDFEIVDPIKNQKIPCTYVVYVSDGITTSSIEITVTMNWYIFD